MKNKLILITLLSLVIALTLVGCDNETSTDDTQATSEDITLSHIVEAPTDNLTIIDSNEIITPASQGIVMPNENVVLGQDIQNAYIDAIPNFENTEADKPYVQFDESRYYYEIATDINGEAINSVYKIVHYKEGYGFSCGLTNINEVIGSLGAQDPKLEPVENLYFMFSKNDNTYSLTYPAGENTLEFYFNDNTLTAIVLESHE